MPDYDGRQSALGAMRDTLAKETSDCKQRRITAWKRQMRQSTYGSGKLAYQWLRGDQGSKCGLLRRSNGELTGNAQQVMGIMHEKWMPTFQRYKDAPEPDPDAFFSEYENEVNHLAASTSPMTLSRIEAADLECNIAKMSSEKATGLDGWSVCDLKALPKTCIAQLATLLGTVETIGKWPHALSKARVTLIPKSSGSTDPGQQRPITVTSTIYRLWASTRLNHCAEWHADYLPWYMHGFCKGRSVEDGIWQATMRIEEAEAKAIPLFGFSMDIAKAFDSVPHSIMFQLAERVGLPSPIIAGLKAMYKALGRRFKFGILGYGPEWKSTNGVLQGCPISVWLLSLLMSVWGGAHFFLKHDVNK